MPFFQTLRRDPASALLIGFAALIIAAIAFGLLGGLDRYYVPEPSKLESSLPTGITNVKATSEGLDLFGWGISETTLSLSEKGKALATAQVDSRGKWNLLLPTSKKQRSFRVLTVTTTDKNKNTADSGKLNLFVSGQSKDGPYVWWDNTSSTQLLMARPTDDDMPLFLALVIARSNSPLIFAGQGEPSNLVQVYADNELAGTGEINSDGYWTITSLLKNDRKNAAFRIDEIDLLSKTVIARREYKLNWPTSDGLAQKEPIMLRTSKEDWAFDAPFNKDGNELVYILKPIAGRKLAADRDIRGQVIPTMAPTHAIDAFR